MALRIDQLKSILIPGGVSSSYWQSISGKCTKLYSLYDLLETYTKLVKLNITTDNTLGGKGVVGDVLKIAQQGATAGQALL